MPPEIDFDTHYGGIQEVKAGSSLILPINFMSTPAPRVTWLHNGVPLSPRPGHVLIDSGETFSTLSILGIEKEEAGKYEAVVENLAGAARHDFKVAVKCECQHWPLYIHPTCQSDAPFPWQQTTEQRTIYYSVKLRSK